jgi:DNA-binding PadR family transcriptional regulator
MAKKSSAHTLEYILLGLIKEEPAHGYALYDKLRSTPELSLIWQVKRSKLYYLLDKLQKAGYLASFPSKDGPYPERTVYQITDQGRESLELWLRSPVLSSRYVRLAFLSKLFFSIRSSREAALDLTSQQITICRGWLSSLEDQSQNLDQGDYINSQIFLFRIGQIQAMLDWLENCRLTIPEQ